MKTRLDYFYRYLPLSHEDRGRQLYVIAGGYSLIPAGVPYPPAKHPVDHNLTWNRGRTLSEYQIVYITRGEGEFESEGGGLRRISAGSIFVLFPGVSHRYRPDSRIGWDEYWVAFQGDQVARLLAEYGISAKDPLQVVGVQEYILHEFKQVAEELRGERVGYQQIIAARVIQIMANMNAAVRRKEFEGTSILRVIEKAKSLLGEQVELNVNVEQLASSLHVGYSWFRRMFRKYVGMPPSQYQLQVRLNRARELLRNSSLSVAAIAEQAGFGSSYYLARVFRRKFGKTPTTFRKKGSREN